MKKLAFPLLMCMAFGACQSREIPDIQGFDAVVWKQDKWGCKGERLKMADTLLVQRDKLLRLGEDELVRILGNPDGRDLYVRNQKFLIYSLEPNQRCQAPENNPVQGKALRVRLNALGKSNEVYISAF